MSQTEIQVVDVKNNLYMVVEQSFEDRADKNETEGTKWETPSPVCLVVAAVEAGWTRRAY
jgi:hypothetical protein